MKELHTAATAVVDAYDLLHKETNNLHALQLRTKIETLRLMLVSPADFDKEYSRLVKAEAECYRIHKCIYPKPSEK